MADAGWRGRRVWLAPAPAGFAADRRAALLTRLAALGAEPVGDAAAAEVAVAPDAAALAAAPEGALRILDAGAELPAATGTAGLVWTLRDEEEWAFRLRSALPAVAVPHAAPSAPRQPAPPDPALGLRLWVAGDAAARARMIEAGREVWRRTLAPLTVLLPGGEAAGPFAAAGDAAQADAVLLPAGARVPDQAAALASGLPVLAEAAGFAGLRPHHPLHALPDAAALARAATAAAYDPAALRALDLPLAATRRALDLGADLGLARSAAHLPPALPGPGRLG
ncbi:hypothetical protein [Falsiroseomonas sp. CW058]|uniref:hypothetical protein n=1 Tax=Falsiroseomonas sp. CW058 TaxID=3388664 RepID=UPI003D3239A9